MSYHFIPEDYQPLCSIFNSGISLYVEKPEKQRLVIQRVQEQCLIIFEDSFATLRQIHEDHYWIEIHPHLFESVSDDLDSATFLYLIMAVAISALGLCFFLNGHAVLGIASLALSVFINELRLLEESHLEFLLDPQNHIEYLKPCFGYCERDVFPKFFDQMFKNCFFANYGYDDIGFLKYHFFHPIEEKLAESMSYVPFDATLITAHLK